MERAREGLKGLCGTASWREGHGKGAVLLTPRAVRAARYYKDHGCDLTRAKKQINLRCPERRLRRDRGGAKHDLLIVLLSERRELLALFSQSEETSHLHLWFQF